MTRKSGVSATIMPYREGMAGVKQISNQVVWTDSLDFGELEIYIPAGAKTMGLKIQIRNSGGGDTAWVRFDINGNPSSEDSVTGTTHTYVTLTLDISALSGFCTLKLQGKVDNLWGQYFGLSFYMI